MDQKAAEQLLDQFITSVGLVWSPGSRLLSSTDTEHAVTTCDNEISKLSLMMERVRIALEDAVRHVAALRNSSSPVSVLPDDILILTFEECASFGSPPERLRTTLSISHVCSYWRSLSLAHRALWSRMDLSTIPERLAWMLCEQSGGYPLSLSWPVSIYSTSRRDFASALCCRYLPRMSRLSLSATRSQLLPWIFDGCAPGLRRVFLQDADAFSQSPLVLRRPLFRGHTPDLQHLSLVGIRLPWARGVYRNLTTLDIMRCNVGPDIADDIDICHIFRDSPSLEALKLSFRTSIHWSVAGDRLLSPESHAVNEQERIPLRALRSLRLELPAPYASHILHAIALPTELKELSLCLDSPQSHLSLLSEVLQPSLIPTEIFASADRLQIGDRPSKGVVQICGFWGDEEHPRWEYSWKHRSQLPHALLRDIAVTIAERYPLNSVQAVQLVNEEGNCHDSGDVLPLLTRLSRVEVFHSLTWSPTILCRMFSASNVTDTPLWPSLRQLSLVISTFESTLGELQDAIVGLCRSSPLMQAVNITYRMPPFSQADAEEIRHVVQIIHGMGINVSCRRVNPYQSHGPLEPVEEFSPV